MQKDNIINFLNKNPELTYKGLEWNKKDPRYEQDRASLYKNLDEIVKCIEWLDRFYVYSNRKKDETNSYVLKHYVEKYSKEYISNGSFVTAYLMKDYEFKSETDNPNIFIRLQQKPLEDHRILYPSR